ncbi:Regulator of Vps4 activity in the MVB pathway protein [Rhynchospora pubera]|uniref:Regulator of Vps4 activity in the MVB pathway protein n=1 Tax=Rhynchospora pubera TaxID=906938 RepID=A0AAV8CYM2_9POAL|nr:Regulator of Vps4 activity in the MVB pathway protein [Rhynchospora pubera]
MSMLDSFFSKGAGSFKGAKCKTLLKLTIPRIKLLRNRREIQLKQMRKDIAKLLENGQEATARIRVEHIIREENMMAAQEILELFCELITVRLPIIETQKECPLDLKEAISTICFAAPRCADLPELMQVQMLFAGKYGKEFVAAAAELLPDCGVNRQVIELLSIRAPSPETKLKLLKEIAEEHGLDWDPSATETEFSKSHEDLLNGPNYNGVSNLVLPKVIPQEQSASNTMEPSDEEKSESDAELDDLDLPEVPKVSVQPTSIIPSVRETGPSSWTPPPHQPDNPRTYQEGTQPTEPSNIPIPFPDRPPLEAPLSPNELKQFIPFMAPPSFPSAPVKPAEPNPVIQQFSSIQGELEELQEQKHEIQTSPQTVNTSTAKIRSGSTNIDLQEVLAAAQEAAETAERAATAARAAADLAQLKINDFVSRNNTEIPSISQESGPQRMPVFDRQDSNLNPSPVLDRQDSNSNPFFKEVPRVDTESPFSKEAHVPQRLSSLEDDPYYSYPNLFSSGGSNSGSGNFSSNRT